MNRFPNRAISLILAVVFLFSAAGISFMLLFKGTTVFADTDAYSIQGARFYEIDESTGKPNGKSTLIAKSDKKYQLEITILDSRFKLEDIYLAEDKKDADDKIIKEKFDWRDKFSVALNNTNFEQIALPKEGDAKEPYFVNDDFKDVKAPNTSYRIVFPCVRFVGGGDKLGVTVNYPIELGIPSTDFEIRGAEIKPSSSNSSYDRPSKDDDDDDSSSSRVDIAPPTPNIIVSEYSYGGGTVTAASKFALTVKFTNTSKKLPIDNIVMKVSVPEAFTMTSSSNTFYIDKMSKESSVERTINLSVKPNAEPISHPIKVNFTFESVIDEARKQYTSEQEISIPVAQLDRFTLNPAEMPAELYVGEDNSISVTFVNKGKTVVYNVSAEISGNISQPGQRQFIGNIDGGKEDSADFMIGALEPGPVSGEIIITYEDANMNVNELRTPFNANAIALNIPPMDGGMAINPEDMPPDTAIWYKTFPIWGWMVGGVVLVIFAAFAVKLVRARREKRLEEQDEDI